MIEPNFKLTFEGQPMEVLSRLVRKRMKWCHETYRDAIVATAITALQSIRASTIVHKAGKVKVSGG